MKINSNWSAKVAQDKGMLSAAEARVLISKLVNSTSLACSAGSNVSVDVATLEQIDQYILRWRAYELAISQEEDPSVDPWENDGPIGTARFE